MSQSVIGALRVNLGLDSAQFVRGSRRVEQPLQRMRKQFQAVAGVAAAMGAAISAAAIGGAREIDETAKAARRLDASIGGFRAVELAASEAGVSLSSLTNDIQTMNRELASIGTSGNGQRALAALGIDLADIQDLDVDAKLALIADQVQALGLDAGQTTAILRDLGVRNREMALLVLQGGDAIRSARDDIADYGLEISDFDASMIEKANDALGRLGLVTQYAGQQLAIALVPAMGKFAEAITDSLREGGLLRTMIDGLANNIDVLVNSAGVAVTVFGLRYVGALALAKGATLSLTGVIAGLRSALISTGIGGLIVGAGYLVAKFADLAIESGGVAKALRSIVSPATDLEVATSNTVLAMGDEITQSQNLSIALGQSTNMSVEAAQQKLTEARARHENVQAIIEEHRALALGSDAYASVSDRIKDVQDGLRSISAAPDTLLGTGRAEAYEQLEQTLVDLRREQAAMLAGDQEMTDQLQRTAENIKAIEDALATAEGGMVSFGDTLVTPITLSERLTESLQQMGLAGGGAAAAIQDVEEAAGEADVSPLVAGVRNISDGMIDAIANGQNLLQSFVKILGQMALEALKADIGGLIGGIFGGAGASGGGAGILGLGASLFGGARAMGGPVRAGMPYLVNENTARSEIFVPSQSGAILNVPQAQRALGGSMSQRFGGQGNVNVEPRVEVIVLDDPRKIDEYRTSPAGERARLRADRRLSGG